MSREKNLFKNTLIIAIGKIFTQALSFLFLPLYTSILTTEEYGVVDLFNTYILLFIPLLFLQIDQGVFRFLIDIRDDNRKKEKLISTIIFTVIFQCIIYIMLFLIISKFLKNQYKYFFILNIIASCISNLFLQISRGLGDNVGYAIGSWIIGSLTIIFNVVFIVIFKFGVKGILLANLLSNIFCILYIFIYKKLYKYCEINKYSRNLIKEVWKYSIPLVPNQLSWWIVNASDRTIITFFLGIATNGIFSISNKFSSICIIVFSIFNISWTESASLYINDKDCSEYFSKIINESCILFISLCFGIISFMPFIFDVLITNKDYKSAYYQIPILIISTIFNIVVSLFGSIYVALKKSREIAKTSIYAAIINIVINICLIKFIGLYAASISTLLAYFIMAIYRFLDIQKYIKINIYIKKMIISIIVGIIIISIYYSKNFALQILGIVISIIFAIINNQKFLFNVINILKKVIDRFLTNSYLYNKRN